ncbi:MAG: hypothetical protein HY791_35875 [Deltaproteobacteria bacterium]|nr:hypothetical protein [Deltaproteobacteria bacterium]
MRDTRHGAVLQGGRAPRRRRVRRRGSGAAGSNPARGDPVIPQSEAVIRVDAPGAFGYRGSRESNIDPPLFHELALPTDPDLDQFSSGNSEVDAYFSKREWFNSAKNEHAPPTYQFRTAQNGEVVGYAAAAFRNNPHPDDSSTTKAKYLVVYVAAVHSRYAGQRNPAAPSETFSSSMFAILDSMARAKAGCVGLCLRVRTDNLRAIAFYEKVGFAPDPGGARPLDDKAPHLTMRKTW